MFTFLHRFAPLGHLLEGLLVFAILVFALFVSPFAAAAIVAAVYYGREAGQREHDLRAEGVDGIPAWLGAMLFYRWDRGNALQFGVPAVGVFVVATLVHYGRLAALPSFG